MFQENDAHENRSIIATRPDGGAPAAVTASAEAAVTARACLAGGNRV